MVISELVMSSSSPLLLHSPYALQPSLLRPSSVAFALNGFARRSPRSAPAVVEVTTAYVEGRGYSTVIGNGEVYCVFEFFLRDPPFTWP